ncbi:MAG: N-acetylmuramoyl-L-alanine amidase [Alphaproteobacteria bacterium]|nr:N-acetylmuramoyl-L-alanine amidase [Alphaproteobacteria bacterium]
MRLKPIIALVIFAFCAFLPQKLLALSVDDVRFGVYPEKVRMVLDLSDIADFRTFVLHSPERIVIDLPHFDWKAGEVERPRQVGISDIRQGKLQPGISRIVFDLDKPAEIHTAYLLKKNNNKPSRIVIDFDVSDVPRGLDSTGKIFGTLSLENANIGGSVQKASYLVPPVKPDRGASNTFKPLIIIDPGHGGVDPGASSGSSIVEKHIVLALGHELKKQLLATGRYRVKMTRERDIFIPLKKRVEFAHKQGGDFFISLHADTIHKKDVSGASVYTLSKDASDKQTARLAEKENRVDLIAGLDLDIEDEQVAYILGDFLITETTNQSKYFANMLVSTMEDNGLKTLQSPHRYAGFAVLKSPEIPSVLIEAGFLSNRNEAFLLNKDSYRRKIARSIVSGLDNYFAQNHRN